MKEVPKVLRVAEVCCNVNKEYSRFSMGVFSRMRRAMFASPEVVVILYPSCVEP